MACINRTVDDVQTLIDFAKLSGTNLFSTTQTLEFPADYNSEQYTLMQLPDTLIQVLKQGDRYDDRLNTLF